MPPAPRAATISYPPIWVPAISVTGDYLIPTPDHWSLLDRHALQLFTPGSSGGRAPSVIHPLRELMSARGHALLQLLVPVQDDVDFRRRARQAVSTLGSHLWVDVTEKSSVRQAIKRSGLSCGRSRGHDTRESVERSRLARPKQGDI